MNQVFHIIKIGLAVIFGVCGSVALWLQPSIALPLFAGSIAWSVMPE